MPRTIAELPSGSRITDYISLGGAREDLSIGQGSGDSERVRQSEHSGAGYARACGRLLCDRSLVVHAVFLPRGVALPFGGCAVAGGSPVHNQGYGQSRDFTGAQADWI